ncbi:restriction endonuclease subunit S [Anaerococcus octavius]|uniref:restriction endonuclease subunit S n=1 Tax=Anaerococcus octavius TaxID=54007 RepID=UPI002355B0B3|nr:restriction endonuclease subunit S [Anaerococcus octavius]
MTRVPELRFDGFDGEWEDSRLADISDVRDGTHDSPKYINEGYPLVTSKNIVNGKLVFDDINYISKEDYININKRSKVDKGDILFSMIGTVGNPLITKRDDFAIKNVALIKNNEKFNNSFILNLLLSDIFKKYLNKQSAGGTQKFISLGLIRNFKFKAPILDEQEKMGDLFSKIDQLIEGQQELVDQTIAFKKSMLQKMFPKKDSLIPEFRFEGFENEWKTFKIKELANIKTGESNTQDADENGEYPFYIRSENPQTSNKYLYDEEAVLTIGDGKIGKVFFYVNGKYDLHQRVYRIFGFNENLDGKYFYHYFSKFFLRRAISLSAKATVDSVRMEMISDMIIKVPNLEEQIKIRDFLENLDKKIAKKEKLLELYKDMKKSLLQKMFV